MKKIIILNTILAGALFASMPSSYKQCIACHGPKGERVAPGNPNKVIIKDMKKEDLISELKSYRDNPKFGGKLKIQMKFPMKNKTDADIQAIADYLIK